MPVELSLVRNSGDVQESLHAFNVDARNHSDLVASLLRTTWYWVFDPNTQTFGPGKFVGFRGMNFGTYRQAREHGTARGKFNGGITRLAIESSLDRSFVADPALQQRLKDWALRLIPVDALANVNEEKWRFVQLSA